MIHSWRFFSRRFLSVKIRLHQLTGWAATVLAGIQAPYSCAIIGAPIISLTEGSRVTFGQRVMLISKAWSTALGVSRPSIIRTLTADAVISIGNDVGMSGVTICAAKSIVIADRTLVGADSMIVDNDFHPIPPEHRREASIAYENGRGIEIGENVFIGARSIILKGVKIGANSVIGAGSVVTCDIPGDVVAGGNPCRVLKQLK